MVVKKKTPKVEAVALDHAVLESLTVSLSVDGDDDSKQIAQMLKDCLVMTDPVQQIQLVSKVGSMLECLKEDESAAGSLLPACLKTLAFIYLTLQAKNPLRRAIASALSNVPAWLLETAVCSLCVCLSESMSSLKSECYPHLTDCITSCLDAFPIGERCIHRLLTEVLQFFQKTMSEYLQLNRDLAGRHVAQAELMQSCLAVVKASMLVVQKSQELFSHRTSTLQEAFSGLLQCYTHILTDEQFIQAVQSTAGMAAVLLIRSVIGNGNDTTDAVAGLLESSERDSTPEWLKQSCAGLYLSSRPAAVSLYLSHGALAMLNWRGRTLDTQAEKLLLLIPDIILSLDTGVKESSTVMVVTRVLTLWSIAAIDCLQFESPAPLSESPAHLIENPVPLLRLSLHGGSPLAERLLNHIYIHWEHPLDGVRHQTRTLFRNLLSIHQLCGGPMADPTYDPYFNQLTQRLLGLEWHIKGKYGSLACLAEHLGAEYLLKLDGDLPSRLLGLMGDQTLAPYASELLEKLFVSHKAQLCACLGDGHAWMENWQRTWVKPLLEVLCTARLDQTTYILDYFLPKLLRCSPASLAHMIQALQEMPSEGSVGSRGPLGALMTCLRAARSQGVLGPVNDEIWGGLVPLSPLRQALLHKHDQVRMDALGLVCESHRSTEILSKQEMELIRHFLPSNLNSQSPGFRQQTISLLKKLLCRMKDSSQSLQRKLTQERDQQQRERDQHILSTYKEFLCWFCESLFMVLRPGASFSSCIVALQLLGLVADHFSFSMDSEGFALGEVVMVPHAQYVLYCLASNFLEVKQLACTLLQKLPPHTVALQDPEKLQCVLQAALDLSTSTKPFDSVTAAHLINLLLCQYDLQQTLLCCAQDQSLSLKLTALIQSQASQASLLEKNTLAVMVFFKACLEDEVAQAEVSLLQAAASHPLYGRLHCITAVLQHLNNRSLQMQTEWMDVVSELIALCYRISDVVSPVIQSSSPEGLIPMDTDSETSAALQKILQEIQPRDTNDFFTCARKLDTTSQEQQKNNGKGSVGEAYRVTAQMVLVCCWRSMKEVSMLLGELCQSMPLHTPHTHKQNGLITEEQVEGVGQYFREQLLQSRHRGAFELAYVGFVRLTEMLCRSSSVALQQLPSRWLKDVLLEVKCSDPSSKLCATRRSAGIPFYIQALLSSEPKSSSCVLLKMTMSELTALAMPSEHGDTDHSTVPQVHALNILRALYRDTRLGENIVPFVSDGMKAAVLGFTSPVWAVRNSSTLLFSTLITRIFGVKRGKDERSKKNRMTGREFFTRFPALYPFLLSQLEEAARSVESDSGRVKLNPSLFLLLLVLGRLYPSPMDGSSSPLGLAPFIPFIISCAGSAVYRTREMAARALVPFVLVTHVPSTIQSLLESLPMDPNSGTQQNHIHGTLLQVLFLLRSFLLDAHRPQTPRDQNSDIITALLPRQWLATRHNSCLVTRGTMVDLLTDLCTQSSPAEDPQVSKLHEDTLSILLDSELVAPRGPEEVQLRCPGATQYLQSLARLATCIALDTASLWGTQEVNKIQKDLLRHLLQCPQYEVRQLALDHLLEKLQKDTNIAQHMDHQLLPFDRISVPTLTHMAMHEHHSTCLAKVLQVLSVLPLSSVLPWSDGNVVLNDEKALEHLLSVAEASTYSVELYCAALLLSSRLMVHLADKRPQELGEAAVSLVSLWGAMVTQCCCEERPTEVKLTTAEVLVKATPTVLTASNLPLSIKQTLTLWQNLFTLLQDEDQDVRDRAADFICYVPTHLNTGVAMAAVSPPVALEIGVGLLCQLLQEWGQVAIGMVTLTEWLLGDDQEELGSEETSDLDEEFLFEKGDLNLWVEPLQWAHLLHTHLCALSIVPYSPAVCSAELDRLSVKVDTNIHSAQQALTALPDLPQFSATIEHTKLTVLKERALLAQKVLETFKQNS